MKLTPKLRRTLRFQHTAFVLLFLAAIGLAGWLSHLYSFQADWTAGNRNTLAEASRNLLANAEDPLTITAYASERESLRREIRRLVGRYQRAGAAEVQLEFINPNAHPQLVREKGIQRDGQLMVNYQGRAEKVDGRSEQAVTQAIQRVMRDRAQTVRFLTGHGERSPKEQGRQGISRFAQALREAGIKVKRLNLAKKGQVPGDTSLLVIADPTQPLLQAEVEQIRTFLNDGGHLLWLVDKQPAKALQPIAQDLGIEFKQGTVVDPKARLLGVSDPTQVIVTSYPRHAITRDFSSVTVFPGSAGIAVSAPPDWQSTALLQTGPQAWLENGELKGKLRFDGKQGDQKGPITLGVALEGPKSDPDPDSDGSKAESPQSGPSSSEDSASQGKSSKGEKGPGQRLVVISDSDYLSNAFLGAGGNQDLALNTVHWLTADEEFINVQPKAAPDTHLRLPRVAAWALPLAFMGGLPLLLFVAGAVIWLRRRQL